MKARVFEAGGDIGGDLVLEFAILARRVDSESWTYGYYVQGRSVRRVLCYNGNGVHYRRQCDEVAGGGYCEFVFR